MKTTLSVGIRKYLQIAVTEYVGYKNKYCVPGDDTGLLK